MTKTLAVALGPLILLAVLSAFFSAQVIRTGMQDEAIKRLEDIVSGVNNSLDALGEGDYRLDGETVYKGEINVSEKLPYFERFAASSGIDITLFYGDTRRVTTLVDSETGERMVGTQAADKVVAKVLEGGQSYVDKKLQLNGQAYFCCYMPLANADGSIVGMIFAGEPSSGIEAYIHNEVIQVTFLNVAVILFGGFLIILFSRALSNAIRKEEGVLRELAQGNLDIRVDDKLKERKDELGSIAVALDNLISELSRILSHLQNSSDELLKSGQSLDEMAERVNANAAEIGKAVEDISQGAVSQAEEIENASGKIVDMGSMIEHIVGGVDKLNSTSVTMKQAGDNSAQIMLELVESTNKTTEAMHKIGEQIYATNESAQKIREAVDFISSIASQTSLLSLNASIEAARAGEFGKGFAVVASEIQKLADESSRSAQTITDIINSLVAESDLTVEIMKEVGEIVVAQRKKIEDTQSHFVDVTEGINSSREDTTMIEERTHVCDESRKTVVDVIANLSAISEENAASAQETTASMEELGATINLLAEAANSLKGLSDQMNDEIKFFKL
ncbi:MAG: methyl-accepting chemotaxis protein [Lachnospiraceae bacterium]|nr:methyl-accepting chemotaxis protein [Lachnospiraceae bacterium]